MSRRILILFAHPAFERSRINRELVEAVRHLPGITLHDLYEAYPDFHLNVPREQELLREHDVIIFQHPFHWYSVPAIIKEWQDLVLEHGFAYGSKGEALRGKLTFHALTTGGGRDAYQEQGFNRFTIRQFLASFEQTASLCGMTFLSPFVVYGTHHLQHISEMASFSTRYRAVVERLRDDRLDLKQAATCDRLNDLVADVITEG